MLKIAAILGSQLVFRRYRCCISRCRRDARFRHVERSLGENLTFLRLRLLRLLPLHVKELILLGLGSHGEQHISGFLLADGGTAVRD